LDHRLERVLSAGRPSPSLQPRAAEAIDPRVPVTRPMNERPVSPALASRLAALVAQARSGEAAFDGPASEAERLAASAGAPQSDGWIEAQEALTAAIAARMQISTRSAEARSRPMQGSHPTTSPPSRAPLSR